MQDDMSGRACDKLYEKPRSVDKIGAAPNEARGHHERGYFFAKSDAFFALSWRHENRDSWKSKTVDRTIRQSRQWLLRH